MFIFLILDTNYKNMLFQIIFDSSLNSYLNTFFYSTNIILLTQ